MLKAIINLGLIISIPCITLEQALSKDNINHFSKEYNMKENLPISDFENLYAFHNDLKNSEHSQPVRNIAKILFLELVNMQTKNSFAIDITRKKMQVNFTRLHLGGLEEFEINLSESDIEALYNLLEKSNMTHWKNNYDNATPGLKAAGNGYLWDLSIQYNDGTAWYYTGESSIGKPYLPEGYDTLVKGLNELAESKKQ
ncbi:hypothetical protein [Aggregatibacter kilianii]|uniref:hypothetical protein n=1 Tax=Aggregatibacter kilianii TaxID=2025884 RepID=UPI000D655F16|nr:hypothetical protein [Aggregatibacter kilianii]